MVLPLLALAAGAFLPKLFGLRKGGKIGKRCGQVRYAGKNTRVVLVKRRKKKKK